MQYQNYELVGKFKVDTYNSKSELVKSTDYFNNFITTSGLRYPYVTGFADCFKLLSIGTDSRVNNISTTGLYSPIPEYQYLSGYFPGYCGSQEDFGTLRLFRGWRVPAEEGTFFQSDGEFKEFSVSPGTGDGFEYAFSRVPKDFPYQEDSFAVVSYKLDINLTNHISKSFGDNMSATAKVLTEDFQLWGNSSGMYRQIHHGLKMVLSAADAAKSQDLEAKEGDSYYPRFNSPMEPCCPIAIIKNSNPKEIQKAGLMAYFSDDNLQFSVNKISGGYWSEMTAPNGDGLAGYVYNLETKLNTTVEPGPTVVPYYKILTDMRYSKFRKPNPEIYSENAKVEDTYDITAKTRFPSIIKQETVSMENLGDARKHEVIRVATFSPVYAHGVDEPMKSLVVCFASLPTEEYLPVIDIVYGSSLSEFNHTIKVPEKTITLDSGKYPYQTNKATLNMKLGVSWSAPCNGVEGCVDGA